MEIIAIVYFGLCTLVMGGYVVYLFVDALKRK